MKNVQITVDQKLLDQVERVGKPLGLNRSQIVRQALRDWLNRHAIESFEEQWIASLRIRSDDAQRAEAWLDIQAWTEK